MTKPHEETWTTGEGALAGALYSGDTWIGSFTDPTRAGLAVQAPALARALLTTGEVYEVRPATDEWHTHDCIRENPARGCVPECEITRSVLSACGVLP